MICRVCPRNCGVDRSEVTGFCSCDAHLRVSRAVRHFWEEPCISGKSGSGAVFFSGCNLKCIYCQNFKISNSCVGKALTEKEFQNLILNISKSGVHNINLVTPSHFTSEIVSALSEIKSELGVPIVWNSSGYERPESIRALRGIVDVFLCDVKYFSSALSSEYSSAPDYFPVAMSALDEMLSNVGSPQFDTDGMMKKGVIVRHLVLPGGKSDSIAVLDALAPMKDRILLSLMYQYTPTPNVAEHKYLSRRTTSLEYDRVLKHADALGFEGYIQDKTSAKSEYTPDFSEAWDFAF